MKRRTFIFATVGISLLCGCKYIEEKKKTKISDISILNLDSSEHKLNIIIEKDGDVKYNEKFELLKKSDTGTSENPAPVINESWMNDPSTFTVKVQLDDDDWHEERFPTDSRSGSCYWIVIRIRENGSLEMPYDANSSGCK